jgi:hypothetical protein
LLEEILSEDLKSLVPIVIRLLKISKGSDEKDMSDCFGNKLKLYEKRVY